MEFIKTHKRYDLSGGKYNRLLVVGCVGKRKRRQLLWLCHCDCGGDTITDSYKLKSGHTKSCGCYNKEKSAERGKIHGQCFSPTYNSWRAMKDRCLGSNHDSYKYYGGKGIIVCSRWLNFVNFFDDMGERPKGKTLERLDNNSNYSLENCVWANSKQQAYNKSNTIFLTFRDKTMTVANWAIKTGFAYETLRARLKRGWTTKMTLTLPLRSRPKSRQNEQKIYSYR